MFNYQVIREILGTNVILTLELALGLFMILLLVGLPLYFKQKTKIKTMILGILLTLGGMLIISNLLIKLLFYWPEIQFMFDSFTTILLSIGALFFGCFISFYVVQKLIYKYEVDLQKKAFILFITLFPVTILFTFNIIENALWFG